MSGADPRHPSLFAIRWRQWRNPPPPLVRAALADLVLAIGGAIFLVIYDWLLGRGAALPGGDLRTPLAALYVLVVLAGGSLLSYLWVELPTGSTGTSRRSGWAALLGLFAAVPITYLALVVAFQVIRPFLE
jgi:hypothetical protein